MFDIISFNYNKNDNFIREIIIFKNLKPNSLGSW